MRRSLPLMLALAALLSAISHGPPAAPEPHEKASLAAPPPVRPRLAIPATQEPARAAADGRAAFLFGYRPLDGNTGAFEEGYRQHLDWHRQAGDRLAWYGWTVSTGDRIGTFIDGTFGVAPAAFDRRVDPAGDRADFARTTAPHAEPVSRSLYRLRPAMSTATPLEDRQPPAAFQALYCVLRSGSRDSFERELVRARDRLAGAPDGPRYAWYELVDGGATPSLLLLISRPTWGDYSGGDHSLEGLLRAAHDDDPPPSALAALREAVVEVRSETWTYRPDLTYLPDDGIGATTSGSRRR